LKEIKIKLLRALSFASASPLPLPVWHSAKRESMAFGQKGVASKGAPLQGGGGGGVSNLYFPAALSSTATLL